MEIIVSGRHFEVSGDLREHTANRMGKLAVEYPKTTTIRVVMEVERGWHQVEAHVAGKDMELEATSRTRDMYVSVDEAFEKLERQLRRHLEKVGQHRRSKQFSEQLRDGTVAAIGGEETETEDDDDGTEEKG